MRSLKEPVISHWHKSIDNFETSALDFYAAVEAAVTARNLPEVRMSRVEYAEGGILSAARIYLRVTRRRLAFDICAAPFGRGYFFSSWMVEAKSKMAWGCVVIFLALALTGFVFDKYGSMGCGIALLVLIPAAWIALLGVREGWFLSEDAVLAVPYLGVVYEYLFSPATYFKEDSALMFQDAVHSAMLEVVDGLLEGKGLRALAPEDRKPAMRSLVR